MDSHVAVGVRVVDRYLDLLDIAQDHVNSRQTFPTGQLVPTGRPIGYKLSRVTTYTTVANATPHAPKPVRHGLRLPNARQLEHVAWHADAAIVAAPRSIVRKTFSDFPSVKVTDRVRMFEHMARLSHGWREQATCRHRDQRPS